MKSNVRQPPQTANNNQSAYSNLDFSEPPDVQVVEASCELSDKRSIDNSEWTNILKEPIFIAKGSEIRCASTFLDMKGMDQEIIQFESSGTQQDNSHTIMGQIYTVNDGFNGKTSSYDYMCRPQQNLGYIETSGQNAFDNFPAWVITDVGSALTNGNHIFRHMYDDVDTTLEAILSVKITAVGPPAVYDARVVNSISITSTGSTYNNGINYVTGDPLIFDVGSDLLELADKVAGSGYVICNDLGQITNFVITTRPVYRNKTPVVPGATSLVTVSTVSGGSGAILLVTLSNSGGCNSATLVANTTGLYEYQYDNSLRGVYQAVTSPGGVLTNFTIHVLSTDPDGALINAKMFDQGYNYQKSPLYRYCQTFAYNNQLTYGNQFLERSYITGAGNSISLNNRPPELLEDSNFSAYNTIKRREDEFCPGVFHNQGIDNIEKFDIYGATTRLSYSNNQIIWKLGWQGGYSCIWAVSTFTTQQVNGVDYQVESNILSRFAIGQSLSLSFQIDQYTVPGSLLTTLQEGTRNLSRFWGGLFQVGKNESEPTGIYINGNTYYNYRKITLASPRIFKSEPKGELWYIEPNGVADDLVGTPNTSSNIALINVSRDDGETMTGSGGILNFNWDHTGTWSGYAMHDRGTGYKCGDILRVPNEDGTPNSLLWYVTQVDNNNGTTFGAPQNRSLERSDMRDSFGGNNLDFVCVINPIPYYQCGLGNITLRTPTFANNINSVCVIKDIDRDAGCQFIGYTNYPPIMQSLGIQSTAFTAAHPGISYGSVCGLYKNSGKQYGDLGYNNLNAQLSAHSLTSYTDEAVPILETNTSLDIYDSANNQGIRDITLICGLETADANVLAMPTNQTYIDIRQSTLTDLVGIGNEWRLPTNYLQLKINTTNEEHVIVAWIEILPVITSVPYLRFHFRTRAVHNQEYYNQFTSNTHFGATGIFGNNTDVGADQEGFGFKLEAVNYETALLVGDEISLHWIDNEATFFNKIPVSWRDGEGDIPFTATTNFYNTNDTNLESLKNIPVWNNILVNNQSTSQSILNSYNEGGVYFLSHHYSNLRNAAGTNPDTEIYSTDYGISQGFNEFILTDRIPNEFVPSNNQAYFPTQSAFVTNLVTTTESVFAYEPLYKQKTFTIDRDFAVPSDIGGFWTRDSHKLLGIQDNLTGQQLTTVEDCGILQNEFIFPVFGSNNRINARGEYIKDLISYPDSGGLEAGHVIGKMYIDENSEYLNTKIKYGLPSEPNTDFVSGLQTRLNARRFTNIFFRTFFTQVRNYDPLKTTPVQPAAVPPAIQYYQPDRTPLKTISTKAGFIGNLSYRTGYVKEDSTATPAIVGKNGILHQKYALDGKLFIDSTSQGPGAVGPPTLVDTFSYNMYELGDPNPSTQDEPYYAPSTSKEYPVRYLENNTTDTYGRAKISSFVGSTNMTLAYQTDLSTFAFEFFYTPYTSPYEDGAGGDISARIFYGNRKKGVYNHDSLGGFNVVNWCRPDYPLGIISYRESLGNLQNSYYPNGMNPFIGTATIGRDFLNKLGFTDGDLSIVEDTTSGVFTVDTSTNLIDLTTTPYQQTIIGDDGVTTREFYSYNQTINRTNQASIDSSVAILTAIPAPEANAGLNNNITIVSPQYGKSSKIINRWGDYIFYPYSIDANTNTFNQTGTGTVADPVEASKVRWDNATDTYASVGGLNLTEVGRGMGTPNTTGSTTICNQTTIPVTLNPDCNIYLSYTVQTASNFILASGLPRKLNHGHLIVISNLIERPNYHLPTAGAINALSVVNKSFITGDFILSIGQMSFYAPEDRWLSRITTKIVNSSYVAPTTLGTKSTVIYSIINNQPKPRQAPTDIVTQQNQDYETMAYLAQHQEAIATGGQSKMATLHDQLYQLGISTIVDPLNSNATVISQLSNYITGYDLPSMSARERQQFYTTPEGGSFLQAASNYSALRGQMEELDASGDPDEQAVLSENLNLQLRALNRGNILPPVPISQDALGSNPELAQTDFLSDMTESGFNPPQEGIPVPEADLSMVPRGAAAGGPSPPQTVKGGDAPDSGAGTSIPPSYKSEAPTYKTEDSGAEKDKDKK